MKQYDGRMISEDDFVTEIGKDYATGLTVFLNRYNYIRICNSKGVIIVDFNELCHKNNFKIKDDRVLITNGHCQFKMFDLEGNLIYQKNNILNFKICEDLVVLNAIYDDKNNKVIVVTFNGEIFYQKEDEVLTNFNAGSSGFVYTKYASEKGVLSYQGKIFDHGFLEILDVLFLGNYTLILGTTINQDTCTVLYYKDKEIASFNGIVEPLLGKHQELLIKSTYLNHIDFYLYDDKGCLLEKFLDESGSIFLEDNGILLTNSKGYKKYYDASFNVVFDYKDKYDNIAYISETLFGASSKINYRRLFKRELGDYHFTFYDINNVLPKSYLNDAYSTAYIYNFLIISRLWKQNGEVYHSVLVFNKEGKLVVNRFEIIKNGKGLTTTMINDINESSISFNSESGIVYFDIYGNEYQSEPIVFSKDEIYIKNKDYYITKRLPELTETPSERILRK